MQLKPTRVIALMIVLSLTACDQSEPSKSETPVYGEAAFAMPDTFSANAVEAVLRSGGNAVQAADAPIHISLPQRG